MKNNRWFLWFVKLLRKISVGKYQTKLYDRNGEGSYSTVLGGLFTLVSSMVLGVISISILFSTISRRHYNMD